MISSSEVIIDPTPISSLEAYETWSSLNWIYEQGTSEAQLHVRGKLSEEASELATALSSENHERIVDELGDFLWTASANGHNANITFTESMRHELRKDQIGEGPILLSRIDELALDLIPDSPVTQMEGWVQYLGHYLGKAAKQWRNLSPLIDTDAEPQNFSEAWIQLKRSRTRDALVQSVLITSALAQRYANVTLSDVVNHNVEKLQNRTIAGLPVTSQAK